MTAALALRRHDRRLLTGIEGRAYAISLSSTNALDELEIRARLDERSDAVFRSAISLLETALIEDPRAPREVSIALERVRAGLILDGYEDAPCDAIRVGQVGNLGLAQAIAGSIEQRLVREAPR